MYLGINDTPSECQEKIKNAPVLKEVIFPVKFRSDICARCAARIRSSEDGKNTIVFSDGTDIPYELSKCHPSFQPKCSKAAKIAGGFAHNIATLGIPLAVAAYKDTESWPGFTNSDEECHNCKQSPGALGCTPVLKHYRTPDIVVDHSTQL